MRDWVVAYRTIRSLERRQEYLDWTEQVIAGLRGVNPSLEKLYFELLAEGRRVLGGKVPDEAR